MKIIEVKHTTKVVTIELNQEEVALFKMIGEHRVFGVDLRGTHKCTDGDVCGLINELANNL
jgi:hypothetical protein